MQLELLSALPAGNRRDLSVLLVHGICLGAWVWDEKFLPYLAEQGFPTFALSLRGHGRSDGHERIHHWQLRDFADDLAWAMHRIGGPTVIVGHSMGGGVVQYYLRQGRSAAGVVLMASAPPHGLMHASMAMYQHNRPLWDELFRSQGRQLTRLDLRIIEEGLFSEPLEPGERKSMLRRLSPPAVHASFELMGWPPIAPLPWSVPPMMILGGERDQFIPPADVFMTGAYYGVNPTIIPECAHAVMLDRQWQDAADLICGWIDERVEVHEVSA